MKKMEIKNKRYKNQARKQYNQKRAVINLHELRARFA